MSKFLNYKSAYEIFILGIFSQQKPVCVRYSSTGREECFNPFVKCALIGEDWWPRAEPGVAVSTKC